MRALPGYDVTPAELYATSAQLTDIVADVSAELARLQADVDALLDGGWRGSAATAFRAGWTQWSSGAREVLAALDRMGRLLGATGRDYEESDAESIVQLGEL